MVFIEEKHSYLRSLADQPKQKALYALVSDETLVAQTKEILETDAIYYTSIQAIKKNAKADFNTQYAKISKRKVSEKSAAPFVHDDFLIFTLVIGVLKFDCDKGWLLGVIRNRAKGKTTTTFENLLLGNYQSKANNQSMVLVFLFLLDKSKITNDHLNEAYNVMSDTEESFNNDFIRIVYYRAFDIIIQFKLPRDTDEVSRLLEFKYRFKKRIKVFSIIAYNLFIVGILVGAYKILQLLPEDKKLVVNDLNLIIGLGAIIGLSGNFIPKLKTKFQELILRIFGFKQY
ncbi:hypothetical protein [Arenibacter lacus]|uniref:hypothetical protein n=1 Tax=Arenibacter lacus TaxID=2608629 RepID=UPI00123DFEA3|nr:hypothetical protein [Arenibacter lacus]